ncbi:MAG: hypothetical protein R3195_05820 [Gemmatimonadota bacterium]|nr:hypothetical protein [Gemmatimonadota bacterium]
MGLRYASRPPVLALALVAAATQACWRTGEPTPSDAIVAWAAYPESVRVGDTFLFEFAGPVTPTACGRLDTATLAIEAGAITLEARRSTFSAVCANQRISFYEARPLAIDSAGAYPVTTADGRELGTLVATDSGPFSGIVTIGEGTVREAAGCVFFGPGWIGGQRIFALTGVPEPVRRVAGSDRVVYVRGTLRGFSFCGNWGSRPRIRVDTAWVTDREAADWYGASETPTDEGSE